MSVLNDRRPRGACLKIICIAIAVMMPVFASGAQQARDPVSSVRSVTAAEDSRGILIHRVIAAARDNVEHRGPPDLDDTLAHRARKWIQALPKHSVVGIQLDPMGDLYVVAGQDALAKQQFATRLATPGLSVMDSAYTLALAVSAFSRNGSDTVRMRTALQYLNKLDALPAAAARLQYAAHVGLGNLYYLQGDGEKVVAQLLQAYAVIPKISFLHRGAPETFLQLADVLSGQRDGRRKIDSVANRLLTFFQAPPDLVAIDSAYYWHGFAITAEFKQTLQFTNYLGRAAPEITAQYWWNTQAPTAPSPGGDGATIKRLDDGKVRLIELGSITCMYCLRALWDMDRLHDVLPANAEAWYVTRGYGMWGVKACEPKVESEKLKDFYLTRRKHRMPIALFIGSRVADEDGGTLAPSNPMWDLLGIHAGPVFLITDGRGIVRHVSGGATKGLEPQQRALRFILAEAARGTASTTSSSSARSAPLNMAALPH